MLRGDREAYDDDYEAYHAEEAPCSHEASKSSDDQLKTEYTKFQDDWHAKMIEVRTEAQNQYVADVAAYKAQVKLTRDTAIESLSIQDTTEKST